MQKYSDTHTLLDINPSIIFDEHDSSCTLCPQHSGCDESYSLWNYKLLQKCSARVSVVNNKTQMRYTLPISLLQ